MHSVSHGLRSDRVVGAMDGCFGTRAERLVIAGTCNKVQIVADKVHLVSAC